MKVLHCVPTLSRRAGGLPRAVLGLCKNLDCEVLLKANGAPDALDVPDTVEHVFNFQRTDLIHQHGIWSPSNIAASRYALKNGIPLIISPHGMLEPWALQHHAYRKKLAWWLYQKEFLNSAAGLHATSDAEAAQFRELGLTPRIEVVPHGVERISPDIAEPATSPRVVLFMARIHQKKGVDLLIDAWRKLAPKPSEWQLQISGLDEVGLVGKFKADAPAGVHFTGPVYGPDKDEAFEKCSIFVLPSHSENFGFVVAEALQRARPVITTTATPWESMTASNAGWRVDPTGEAITEALDKALKTPPKTLAAMGARGQTMVRRLYAPHGAAAAMQGFYRKVILLG